MKKRDLSKQSEKEKKNKASQAKSGSKSSVLSNSSQMANIFNHLQITYGNRHVQRLIRAKLKISQPSDKYEREADRIAKQVMHMLDPDTQRQPQQKEPLQIKERNGRTLDSVPDLEECIAALKGRGQPLQVSARSFFEPRLGRDFSRVRIHTDAFAADLASAVNAQAFTVGRNIVFGAGNYAPESMAGRKLLAHELAHVVQQTAGPRRIIKLCQPCDRCGQKFDEVTLPHENPNRGSPISQKWADDQLTELVQQSYSSNERAELKLIQRVDEGKAVTEEPRTLKCTELKISRVDYQISGGDLRFVPPKVDDKWGEIRNELKNIDEELKNILYPTPELVPPAPEVPLPPGEDVKKRVEERRESIIRSLNNLVKLMQQASITVNNPTGIAPIEGQVVFKVEALPEGCIGTVEAEHQTVEYYSTVEPGGGKIFPSLGELIPQSAPAGTGDKASFFSIVLNGTLGKGLFMVHIKPGTAVASTTFEVKGPIEEKLKKQAIKNFNLGLDALQKYRDEYDTILFAIKESLGLLSLIPKSDIVLKPIETAIDLIDRFYVQDYFKKLLEAYKQQAKVNLLAAEQAREETHVETPPGRAPAASKEVHDLEEKAEEILRIYK